MKLSQRSKFFATAAIVVGALGAATAAQARADVILSIGLPVQGGYVQPHHGYVQPHHGYVQPQPVYVQPRPVYVQPQPVYVEQQPIYRTQYDHGNYDGRRYHQRRHWERMYGPDGDLDGDGVPNQYDRDRDGDGVKNRYDAEPNNPYRH